MRQSRAWSLKWRLTFLSISLLILFALNSRSKSASGYLSRHILETLPEVPEAMTDEEAAEEEPVDECFESQADMSMFPPEIFTDEQLANGAITLHVIGMLYMFYGLAIVCDHFFVPSLEVIIEKFGILPDVAGATLMAAGGSAPELFTSFIGVFIAFSDVGIGTIVGSAVFNVLFVIAACAFASATALSLTAWPLARDFFFYSISLILLVIFFMDNSIKWWESLTLFLWYCVYVLFMVFNGVAETQFHTLFPSLKSKGEAHNELEYPAGFKFNRRPLLEIMQGKVTQQLEASTEITNVEGGIRGLKKKLQEAGEIGIANNEASHNGVDTSDIPLPKEEDYEDVVLAGPTGSLLNKIMWFLSMPLMLPMWITMPSPSNPARKKFFAITFLISIIWVMGLSYLMVGWATKIGQIVGISDTVMGLTFLAAGTSVPDLITSVLVAKQGYGDMAVSSSIGSNLFDVTVGLPLPWLLYSIIYQQPIHVTSVGMGCKVGLLFLMLIVVFISILTFKWKLSKAMGGVMIVMYAVFVVVSLGLSNCWFTCPF